MPEAERSRLTRIVAKAHAKGRRVRFWGAPDRPAFWGALLDNGEDLINTDDLDGAQKILLAR
jgi:glycerophosphoryl diester phosphodiesterase